MLSKNRFAQLPEPETFAKQPLHDWNSTHHPLIKEFGFCEPGDPRNRDGAYHQGTVWPWLMGPFMTAYVKTFGTKAGRKFASEWLSHFQEHFNEACQGQVSEIFDGDAPHAPVWLCGAGVECLQAFASGVEDVYKRKEMSAVATSAQVVQNF